MPNPGDIIYASDVDKGEFVSGGNGANSSTFTNTAPAAQTPTVGIAFVAPPSGRVLVVGQLHLRNRTAAGACFGGIQIKTGSTLDAGTVVYNPSTEPNSKVAMQSFTGQVETSCVFALSGLTPGSNYNACVVTWVDAGTTSGDVYVRRVDVIDL